VARNIKNASKKMFPIDRICLSDGQYEVKIEGAGSLCRADLISAALLHD
jgi:hypothetical protein